MSTGCGISYLKIFNFGGMKLLHTKNMVNGFPLIDKRDRVCERCIFGKQHRETFPVGKSYRVHTPLEIVHSNICGPMQTASIGGCNYFLTFIDDYSRKTWVHFLKHKSDAFSCFSAIQGTHGEPKWKPHQNIKD